MTRGFDDLTLTFYETKLCDHDKENWCQYPQAYESLDNENKFLKPIWMCGQNNTRLTLYLGAESKYPQILTLYGLMDLGLTTRINRVFLECFLKSEG